MGQCLRRPSRAQLDAVVEVAAPCLVKKCAASCGPPDRRSDSAQRPRHHRSLQTEFTAVGAWFWTRLASDRSGHRTSEQQPVSESARHLSRVRVTDSGHGQSETANSAAATAGRRTYAGPGGFQVAATTGWPGTGYSQQDSRTAPASSVWPAVADGSTAEHAPRATGGIGRAEQRTRGPPGGGPSGCRASPVRSSMPSHRRIRTQTNGVRRRQQRPVRTRSAVSQYKQPPEGGPPPGPADFFMFAGRGGPGRGISR